MMSTHPNTTSIWPDTSIVVYLIARKPSLSNSTSHRRKALSQLTRYIHFHSLSVRADFSSLYIHSDGSGSNG